MHAATRMFSATRAHAASSDHAILFRGARSVIRKLSRKAACSVIFRSFGTMGANISQDQSS